MHQSNFQSNLFQFQSNVFWRVQLVFFARILTCITFTRKLVDSSFN